MTWIVWIILITIGLVALDHLMKKGDSALQLIWAFIVFVFLLFMVGNIFFLSGGSIK